MLLLTGGIVSVVGGLLLLAWGVGAGPKKLASDPLRPRLGVLGARLFHAAFGLFAVAGGVWLIVQGVNP
jgi:hypothetical protein